MPKFSAVLNNFNSSNCMAVKDRMLHMHYFKLDSGLCLIPVSCANF